VTSKPVIPRALARKDAETALDYYTREAGPEVALRFIDALQSAYRQIGDHPAAGSTRYARELSLPGLRSRALKRFPYLVFYVEGENHVDVWRVLHAQRDIPGWMRGLT